MTYVPRPTVDGNYRIKVLDEPLYVEAEFYNDLYDPNLKAGLHVRKLDKSKKQQEWKISAVPGKRNIYKISSNFDQSNLSYKKADNIFIGFGAPKAIRNSTTEWFLKDKTYNGKNCSKIGDTDDGNTNVWSCWFNNGSDVVSYFIDQPDSKGHLEKWECYVFELITDNGNDIKILPKALDLLILQDATGSQQPYIDKARDGIIQITNSLSSSYQLSKKKLRVGVVAFRDHIEQEPTFAVKTLPLTSDISSVQSFLRGLTARGGGDGPEAVCEAMYEALTAGWGDSDTVKVAVLITDAPPHGAGEPNDRMPDGCPDQNDPIVLAKRMGDLGITLIVVACQPEFGKYQQALNLYRALVNFTGGDIIPLGDVDGLSRLITGAVSQTIDIEGLVIQRMAEVRSMSGGFQSVSKKLHNELTGSGVHINTIVVDKFFEDTPESEKNMKIWSNAATMKEGRSKIIKSGRPNVLFKSGSQSLDLKSRPIAFAQTENIVRKCLARDN